MHEIQVARKLKLQRGTMLVFDRGYMDYDWFQRLTEEGVQFVTRLTKTPPISWSNGAKPPAMVSVNDETHARPLSTSFLDENQNRWGPRRTGPPGS
jgi:hypothetical protein